MLKVSSKATTYLEVITFSRVKNSSEVTSLSWATVFLAEVAYFIGNTYVKDASTKDASTEDASIQDASTESTSTKSICIKEAYTSIIYSNVACIEAV